MGYLQSHSCFGRRVLVSFTRQGGKGVIVILFFPKYNFFFLCLHACVWIIWYAHWHCENQIRIDKSAAGFGKLLGKTKQMILMNLESNRGYLAKIIVLFI